MPRKLDIADKLTRLRQFYRVEERVPGYAEMLEIFEYRSKNAVHGLLRKLEELGYVRKGRGGKTATLVRGVALTGAALETFAREMRQSLGTGGGVEGDAIVLAGDQSARAAQWLRERGATRIVIGN